MSDSRNPNSQTPLASGVSSSSSERDAGERALHQILVSAVKHSALEAFVEIRGDHSSAMFRFEDRAPITVEIECSPELLAGAVLTSFAPTGREGTAIVGVGRVELKSFVVDFDVRIRSGQEASLRVSVGLASASSRKSITLTNFRVDTAENPIFWRGIDSAADTVRKICEGTNGALIVCSPRHFQRNNAISALREAYPYAEIIPLVDGSFAQHRAFSRAAGRLVIAGVQAESDLHVAELLLREPEEVRQLVRGVLAYQLVPRNCPFCLIDSVPSISLSQCYQNILGRAQGRTVRGRGCEVCGNQGVIGRTVIHSILDFCQDSEAGFHEALMSNISPEHLFQTILGTPYQSLYERGANFVSLGSLSMERYVEHLGEAPAAFIDVRSGRQKTRPTGTPARTIVIEGDFFFVPASVALPTQESKPTAELVETVPAQQTPSEVESLSTKRSLQKVLLISSDPEERGQLGTQFELQGFVVEHAASGIEGMLLALKSAPDAIVFNAEGKGAEGDSLLRQIREHDQTKSIPILALLHALDYERQTDLLDCGASDVVTRDIPSNLLQKRLQRLIRPKGESDEQLKPDAS